TVGQSILFDGERGGTDVHLLGRSHAANPISPTPRAPTSARCRAWSPRRLRLSTGYGSAHCLGRAEIGTTDSRDERSVMFSRNRRTGSEPNARRWWVRRRWLALVAVVMLA